MKRIQRKVQGFTDDEMLDRFIRGLDPVIGCELLKENPSTFEEACILAERISRLANLVGSGSRPKFKWNDPPDYAPMDLDNMGARERRRQPDKGGRHNPNNNKQRPTCFVCGKKGHIARECWYNPSRKQDLNAVHNQPRYR